MSLIKISLITSLLLLFIACGSDPAPASAPVAIEATPQPTPNIEATVQARVSKELSKALPPSPTPAPSKSNTNVEKAVSTAVAKAMATATAESSKVSKSEEIQIKDLIKGLRTGIVKEVIDGDTIELSSGERIRYLEVSTPEIGECYGDEAKVKNSELVLNQTIYIQSPTEGYKKNWDRTLAYVFTDKTFVFLELVKNGYAIVERYAAPNEFYDLLKQAEDDARLNNRGRWGKCNSLTPTPTPVKRAIATPTPLPRPRPTASPRPTLTPVPTTGTVDILDQAPTAVPTIKIDDDATGTDSTEDFGQNPSVDEISGKEVADVKEVHLQDTNRYESKTAQQSVDVDDKGDGLQHEFDNLCWTEEDLKNLEKIRSCEAQGWPRPTPTPNLDIKEVDKIAAEKVEKAVIERKIATPTPTPTPVPTATPILTPYVSGIINYNAGKFKEAIDDLSKEVKIIKSGRHSYNISKISQIYVTRGMAYQWTDQPQNALEDLNQAILLYKSAEKYDDRGYIYENLKQYQNALDDYNKGLELVKLPRDEKTKSSLIIAKNRVIRLLNK